MSRFGYDQVSAHPLRASMLAGSLIGGYSAFLSESFVVGLCAGLATLGLSYLIWRPGGPGHRLRRWAVRRFPKRDEQ